MHGNEVPDKTLISIPILFEPALVTIFKNSCLLVQMQKQKLMQIFLPIVTRVSIWEVYKSFKIISWVLKIVAKKVKSICIYQ